MRLLERPTLPLTISCNRRDARLPASRAANPGRFFAALDAPGRGLWHSGGATLVATRPLLRLTLRGAAYRVEPLVESAAPLVDAFAERTARPVATELPPPGLSDHERLVAPSCLDPLRDAAFLLHDRGAGSAGVSLPPALLGCLGYELVDRFERLPPRRADPCDDADFHFVLAGDFVRFDAHGVAVVTRGLPWETRRDVDERHAATVARLVALARDDAAPDRAPPHDAAAPLASLPPPRFDVDDDRYLAGVASLQRRLAEGDLFQAVLSRGATLPCRATMAHLAAAFAALEPDLHRFALELEEGALVGASPELCLRVADGAVELHPIAGTAPRARREDGTLDRDADARVAAALLASEKERAEHAMLVDLARNDVARVSRPGTTRVVESFALRSHRHVHHLAGVVRGALRDGLDALHAFRAVANMGTLTGAPKVRAMERIRELEPQGRGLFGGAVALLDARGRFESALTIRAVRLRRGVAHARAGAGIVLASVPESELAETGHKLRGVREAVALAQGFAVGGARR